MEIEITIYPLPFDNNDIIITETIKSIGNNMFIHTFGSTSNIGCCNITGEEIPCHACEYWKTYKHGKCARKEEILTLKEVNDKINLAKLLGCKIKYYD